MAGWASAFRESQEQSGNMAGNIANMGLQYKQMQQQQAGGGSNFAKKGLGALGGAAMGSALGPIGTVIGGILGFFAS